MGNLMASKPRIQCLDRALTILETLARVESASLTEVAAQVGLHVSTVHNILTVLVGRGYLLNEGGRYRCGPALAALAGRGDPLANLPTLAQPYLEAITGDTGESAVVGVISASGVTVLAVTPSADGMSCPAVNQVFRPAMMLATGRLLVAHGPETHWEAHITAHREHVAGRGGRPDSVTTWRRRLSRIRREDRCVVPMGRDSGSVAVPLRDARGVVVAALGGHSIGRMTDEDHWGRLVTDVEKAGRDISAAMGYVAAEADEQ